MTLLYLYESAEAKQSVMEAARYDVEQFSRIVMHSRRLAPLAKWPGLDPSEEPNSEQAGATRIGIHVGVPKGTNNKC